MQLLLLCQSERCTRPPCSRTAAPDGATTHILVRRLAQRRHGQLSTCSIEPAGRSNAPGDWPDACLGLGQREVGRGERWRCSAGAGGGHPQPSTSIAKPGVFGKVPPHRGARARMGGAAAFASSSSLLFVVSVGAAGTAAVLSFSLLLSGGRVAEARTAAAAGRFLGGAATCLRGGVPVCVRVRKEQQTWFRWAGYFQPSRLS